MSRQSQRAFTLVELAIVLVIIGLLVGGILVGKELVYQAGLTSVVRNISQTRVAMNAFRDKYGKLPGDFSSATKFWGVGNSCPGNAGTGTCDGNGDNVIHMGASTGSESTFLWQHLALAGLIEGKYNPNWPDNVVIDANYVPHMQLNNWGKYVATWETSSANWFDTSNAKLNGRSIIYVGDVATGTAAHTNFMAQTMPCADAKALDDKLDDVMPGTGQMHAERTGGCMSTTTAANGTTAHYLNPAQYSGTAVTTIGYIVD